MDGLSTFNDEVGRVAARAEAVGMNNPSVNVERDNQRSGFTVEFGGRDSRHHKMDIDQKASFVKSGRILTPV
jgi:hypothetical protein